MLLRGFTLFRCYYPIPSSALPSHLSRPARLASVAVFDVGSASTMTAHACCRTPAGLNHWPHTPLLLVPPLPGFGVAASPVAAFRSSSHFSTDAQLITDGLA